MSPHERRISTELLNSLFKNSTYWFIGLLLLCFAVFVHDPQGTISDDMRGVTIMEHLYADGDFSLRKNSNTKIGINEMAGHDGRVYSASLLGPSLWYSPLFIAGKAFNLVASLPAGMRPRSNFVHHTPEYESSLSRDGLGDWAPVFARMGNAILFPLMYFLLLGLGRMFCSDVAVCHLYALGTLFGTQQLLLNHSNYDHVLNGFGLLVATYSAFRFAGNPSVKMGLLCGLGLCISITTRAFSLIYLPIFFVFLLTVLVRTRQFVPFIVVGIPIAAGLAINLWYNWIRSGDFLSSGYDEKWIQFTSLTNGLYRYTLTLDHSVFIHSPLLLLGLWGAIAVRSFKWIWLFPASIAIVHVLFYLKWTYPGGLLAPLRFFSEIFFIVLLPVCGLLARGKLLYTFWSLFTIGLLNSVFLSFIDFRRTSPAPASFFTWRSPVIPPQWSLTSEGTETLIHNLKDAWVYAWPDWFGLMVGGWVAGVVALSLSAAAGVFFWLLSRRSTPNCSSAASLCVSVSVALAALLVVAVPFKNEGKRISSPEVELRNLQLNYNRGNLMLLGDYAARESKYHAFQVRLTNQAFPDLQYCYSDNFKFGADYYNTGIFPPSGRRGDLAAFRQIVPLPAYFPPGNYSAQVVLSKGEGATTINPIAVPDSIEVTANESFLSVDKWFLSGTCHTKDTTFPVLLKKGQTAAITIKLPSGTSQQAKLRLFASPSTGTLELFTSLGEIHKIPAPYAGHETQLKVPTISRPLIISVRCVDGENLFAGASIEPI